MFFALRFPRTPCLWILITLSISALPVKSQEPSIKKSKTGICHAPDSRWYTRTQSFQEYRTLEDCLTSGGRLPKNYRPKKSEKLSYERSSFGRWSDDNNDCLNTRHELLKKLSTGPTTLSTDGCKVLRGRWNDPYTGQIFFDAQDVDIDHIVPLKVAWIVGANKWTTRQRSDFSNDERNLMVVSKDVNRQKGDKNPLAWLPPNQAYQCSYILRYLQVLVIYDLDESHIEKIRELRGTFC